MRFSKIFFANILQGILLPFVFLTSCTKSAVDTPLQETSQLQLTSVSASDLSKDGTAEIPFEKIVFVPCANGGNGEDVKLTGASKIVYQITWNDRGSHMVFHENFHGVTGVGLASNESFITSGKTEGSVGGSWDNNHFVRTMIQDVRITGQNTRFTIRYNLHITVSPDGNVSFKKENETVDCKVR